MRSLMNHVAYFVLEGNIIFGYVATSMNARAGVPTAPHIPPPARNSNPAVKHNLNVKQKTARNVLHKFIPKIKKYPDPRLLHNGTSKGIG